MDEAAVTRRAAVDALGAVEPPGLRDRLENQLGAGSMVPGVLTILAARATRETATVAPADDSVFEPVARRAAGVQLIYEGLGLTRTLAATEPWVEGDREEADLSILVADVLVAQGFYLLARTEAADQAVETVRAFGRDQTVRWQTDDDSLDVSLEADVLELAVVAGATASDIGVTPALMEFATELADRTATPGFPDTEVFFPENIDDRLATLATDTTSSEGVTTVDD